MDYKEEGKSDFFTASVPLDSHYAGIMINRFRPDQLSLSSASGQLRLL